jgi:hypothetical protein
LTDPKLAQNTARGRYYTHPGNMSTVPSITNIKDMKNIPGLKFWAAKECGNYAADNRAKLATLERDEVFQLVRNAPFAPKSKKNQSSTVGDVVHGWFDSHVKGEPVDGETYIDKEGRTQQAPIQSRQMWRQVIGKGGFVERYGPRFVESEFTVWSNAHGYAGTGDLAAYIGRYLVLIDHKTGNDVYPDVAMQLAALANADFILEPDGTERDIPPFEKFAVLHIRPRGYRLIPVDNIDAAFRAFLGLKEVFDWVVSYEEKTLLYAPKNEVRLAA